MASQIFSTKNPDQLLLLREPENPDRQIKRTQSAFRLTALGIGAIVGAGIFRWSEQLPPVRPSPARSKNAADELHDCRSDRIGLVTRKTENKSSPCDFINAGCGCLRLCSFL